MENWLPVCHVTDVASIHVDDQSSRSWRGAPKTPNEPFLPFPLPGTGVRALRCHQNKIDAIRNKSEITRKAMSNSLQYETSLLGTGAAQWHWQEQGCWSTFCPENEVKPIPTPAAKIPRMTRGSIQESLLSHKSWAASHGLSHWTLLKSFPHSRYSSRWCEWMVNERICEW